MPPSNPSNSFRPSSPGRLGNSFRSAHTAVAAIALLSILVSAAGLLFLSLVSFPALKSWVAGVRSFQFLLRFEHFNLETYLLIQLRGRQLLAVLLLAACLLLWFRDRVAAEVANTGRAVTLDWRHLRRRRAAPAPQAGIRFAPAILGLLVAIAAALRLEFIHRVIRYDEAFTALNFAAEPLFIGLIRYSAPNNHLFHTLLVHFAISLFGNAEWVIRLPALLAGILTVPLTCAFTRRFATPPTAAWASLIAAAFVATSSILVEYSINARGYTLLCVFALSLAICAAEIRRRLSPLWCLGFAVCAVLGFWTVPVFLFAAGPPVLWLLRPAPEDHHRSSRYRRLLLLRLAWTVLPAAAATALLYVPVIIWNGPQALVANKWVTSNRWFEMFRGNKREIATALLGWHRDLGHLLPWVIAALALIGICVAPGLRRLLLFAVAWTLALLLTFRFVPFDRTWLMFLPMYLAAVAIGLTWLTNRLLHKLASGPAIASLKPAVMPVLILLIVLATGLPVAMSRSIWDSHFTGAFPDAKAEVDYLLAHGATPATVYRQELAGTIMDYYFWRRLNTRDLPAPEAQDLRLLKPRDSWIDAWIVVNLNQDESLSSTLHDLNLSHVEILEMMPFQDAKLYHIRYEAQPGTSGPNTSNQDNSVQSNPVIN